MPSRPCIALQPGLVMCLRATGSKQHTGPDRRRSVIHDPTTPGSRPILSGSWQSHFSQAQTCQPTRLGNQAVGKEQLSAVSRCSTKGPDASMCLVEYAVGTMRCPCCQGDRTWPLIAPACCRRLLWLPKGEHKRCSREAPRVHASVACGCVISAKPMGEGVDMLAPISR